MKLNMIKTNWKGIVYKDFQSKVKYSHTYKGKEKAEFSIPAYDPIGKKTSYLYVHCYSENLIERIRLIQENMYIEIEGYLQISQNETTGIRYYQLIADDILVVNKMIPEMENKIFNRGKNNNENIANNQNRSMADNVDNRRSSYRDYGDNNTDRQSNDYSNKELQKPVDDSEIENLFGKKSDNNNEVKL